MLTCSRLLKLQSLSKEFLPASDNGRVQILCKLSGGSGKVPMLLSKICKLFPSLPFILFPIRELCIQFKVAASRTLAPLRRVITRELKVFEYQRFGPRRPLSFVVIDSLDCGHSFTEYAWNFLDLINGYSDAPHVTARRHRCHECRDIAAAKKPVRSVQIAKAVAA